MSFGRTLRSEVPILDKLFPTNALTIHSSPVKAINQEHRKAGLFKVELWTWEKISKLIRQYTEVEQQSTLLAPSC
jgi:hypothetical protein